MNTAYDFSVEFGVTKAYQQAKHLPLPQRELACLRAMEHPEKYRNLFVRVGGFSTRFVTLEKAVQVEIVRRTLY